MVGRLQVHSWEKEHLITENFFPAIVPHIEKKATENAVNLFSRLTYFHLLSTNRHVVTLLPKAQTLGIF